jgi:tetratricopeptide (TPR) repeat protein
VDAYFAGRWDEAVDAADALIEQSEQGTRHYMEHACRVTRSVIRLGRGDVAGAIEDASTSLELAEGIKDPQTLHPVRAYAARVFLEVGRRKDASDQINRLLVDVAAEGVYELAHAWTVDLAVAMAGLRREQEFLERAPTLAASTRWLEAATRWAEGAYTEAAVVLDEIGALPLTAEARLRAAATLIDAGRRPEADEQLRQALAFFRSVGATRYVREGEVLLAAAS